MSFYKCMLLYRHLENHKIERSDFIIKFFWMLCRKCHPLSLLSSHWNLSCLYRLVWPLLEFHTHRIMGYALFSLLCCCFLFYCWIVCISWVSQKLFLQSVATGHSGSLHFRDIISKAAVDIWIQVSYGYILFLFLLGKYLKVELLSCGKNMFNYRKKQ